MALEALADLAAIVTAAIAVVAYGKYRFDRRTATARLESAVHANSNTYMDELIPRLRMTEAEIFEAARASQRLEIGIDGGPAPIAAKLWFRLSQ